MIKISIITVCYNCESVIEKTILSVINQIARKNIEYIIVDGCSTDCTINIINKYKESIDIIISEKDEGIYDAMNKGIKAATGDYVFFLNADDKLYSNTVIGDLIEIIKLKGSKKAIYYGYIELINEYGVFIQKPRDLKIFPQKMAISHQAVFVERCLILNNLFDTKYKFAADYKQLSNFYLDNVCFCYVDKCITSTPINTGATYDNYIKSIKEHYLILKERGCNVFFKEKKTILLRTIIRYLKLYLPNCIQIPLFKIVAKYKIL